MTNFHKLASQSTRCTALALAIVLTACSNIEAMREAAALNEQANTVYPKNYKAEILSFMRTYLNDPTQIRDAAISDPAIKTVDGMDRYIVCVRYNAKKGSGQYAGTKDNIVTFRQGRLDRIIDTVRDPRDRREGREIRETCKDMAMKPFAELERLVR